MSYHISSVSNTLGQENHLKTHHSNFYFERILDFQSFCLERKMIIYERLFLIISFCYSDIDLENFIQTFEHLTGKVIILILKELKTKKDIGFTMCTTDSVYFLENNLSKENLFQVSFYEFDLLPNFRGQGLGKDMFHVIQQVLREQYSGCNRLSFNHFGHIFYYKLFFKSCGFFFPGPFEMPNENIQKLFHLLKSKYLDEDIIEFEKFLVRYKVSISGFDSQRYLREHQDLDQIGKFFVDLVGFRPRVFLMGLGVHELIPGNSLDMQDGVFEDLIKAEYEIRDYYLSSGEDEE